MAFGRVLISGESLYESQKRASDGYDIPERNSDMSGLAATDNFAKRNANRHREE
jgi:hypothetical protein